MTNQTTAVTFVELIIIADHLPEGQMISVYVTEDDDE